MLLENDEIKLRAIEPTDLELLYEWENNIEIWNVSNTLNPFSKYVLKQYIENSHLDLVESKQLRLIIELKYTLPIPLGTIDLFDIDFINSRAGVGILIAQSNYRNKGYASQTLDILHEYCKIHLNFNQLYCNIDIDNANSIKLFESKGYEQTGVKKKWKKKQSDWIDVLFFQHFL